MKLFFRYDASKYKILALPFVILIEIFIYILIVYLFEFFFTEHLQIIVSKHHDLDKTFVTGALFRTLYLIGFSSGYYFLLHSLVRKEQIDSMEKKILRDQILQGEVKNELSLSQNAHLKAQINPHFLLNTLSYLYNETYKLAPKAAKAILSLSEIMQYALSRDVSGGFTEIGNEIKHIENFLSLYKVKKMHPVSLELEYDTDCLRVKFIPLVLLTLMENMLKHGDLDNNSINAYIKIDYEDSILQIRTRNLQSFEKHYDTHGIGLKNTRERLANSYGEKATFEYYLDTERIFHTKISVII